MQTKVKDVMKENPTIVAPDDTLRQAAEKMGSVDCGVLPVGTWDRLEGIITDRDIVVRAVAKGKDANTEKVRDYMTTKVVYCKVEDTLEQAAEQMRKNHISRLAVQDRTGKACGIITFGCILRKDGDIEEINKVIECAVGRKKVA